MLDEELAGQFADVAEDLARDARREPVGAEGFAPAAWRAAADAGWFDVLRTSDAGGLGLGLLELNGIFRAAGRHLFGGPLLEHAVAMPLALNAATAEQRSQWTARWDPSAPAIALVDAGSVDAAAVTVDGTVVHGDLDGVVLATTAKDLLVIAADPHVGDRAAIVPIDREGITVTSRSSLDPHVRYAHVDLRHVSVQPDEWITDLRVGDLRDSLRIMIACDAYGAMEEALRLSVAHAKVREQFGAPIGSFQAIQQILAEMTRRAIAIQSICHAAVRSGQGTEEVSAVEACTAKAAVATHAPALLEDALQVHGGIAFTIEHELHKYYLRVLRLQDLYGSHRTLSRTIGRSLLGADANPWPQLQTS